MATTAPHSSKLSSHAERVAHAQKALIPFLIAALVLAGLSLIAAPSFSQQDKPVEAVMKVKLRHAQDVLQGLATEDFDNIRTNATRLSTLSKAAAWQVDKGPEYAKLSEDFRRAVDDMAAHAKQKNLDACTLDYVQMTMVCVRCHKHVRKIGITRIDAPMRPGDVITALASD